MLSSIVTALGELTARVVNPIRPAVVSVGMIHGGTAPNVFADSARCSGTIRAFDLQQFTLRIVCSGPANGFDAVALPGDRVLLTANPEFLDAAGKLRGGQNMAAVQLAAAVGGNAVKAR